MPEGFLYYKHRKSAIVHKVKDDQQFAARGAQLTVNLQQMARRIIVRWPKCPKCLPKDGSRIRDLSQLTELWMLLLAKPDVRLSKSSQTDPLGRKCCRRVDRYKGIYHLAERCISCFAESYSILSESLLSCGSRKLHMAESCTSYCCRKLLPIDFFVSCLFPFRILHFIFILLKMLIFMEVSDIAISFLTC